MEPNSGRALHGMATRSVSRFMASPGPGSHWEPHFREAGGKVVTRQPFSLVAARRRPAPPNCWQAHVRSAAAGVDLVVLSQSSFPEVLPSARGAARCASYIRCDRPRGPARAWPLSSSAAEGSPTCFESAAGTFFVSQATLDLCRMEMNSTLPHGAVIRNPFNVRYDAHPPWPGFAFLARTPVGLHRSSGTRDKRARHAVGCFSSPHWRERNILVSMVGSGPQERGLRRRARS